MQLVETTEPLDKPDRTPNKHNIIEAAYKHFSEPPYKKLRRAVLTLRVQVPYSYHLILSKLVTYKTTILKPST